jgi:starch-binding outer membrane protein, SusD/RagB family
MKNILRGSIIFTFILLITGCSEEYLDPVPVTSLSDLTVFETSDRILAQVNGMYSSLKSGNHLGGRFMVYNDIRCENFIPNSTNGVTNYQTWNHTVLSSTNEVQNLWGAVYATINVVNVFLDGLTTAWDAGKLDGIIEQAEYDQYRSEAYTVRAICYFDLMQMYSKPYHMGNGANQGVPLRLKAMKSAEENDLAPSTVAEVYTQILKDLNDAEPLAIADYDDDLLNVSRVHRNTIIALKTRVYLHMQNWAQVVTESAKIVSSAAPFTAASGVANTLNASYAGIFVTPFTTKESILSMPMTATNNPGTQNNLAHYYFSDSGESYHLVQAPGSVYTTMDATDARKVMMSTVGGKVYLTKWVDQTERAEYAPVIRYAEVLLNRAEAIVRSGSAVTQEAVDLLNAVRTRSFATGAYTPASFADAAAFYDAILLERNMEFLGEGIRNMDLMRLGLTIPGKDGDDMGVVDAVPSSGQTYIWPVPASELNYNKLMTPNN